MNHTTHTSAELPTDFTGWWNAPGAWVEEPNQRRNGWSGMMRLRIGDTLYYIKKQCNHLCRTLDHPFGWPTASRERLNIGRLQKLGLRVPTPVFHGERKTAEGYEAVLVTEELAGFLALDTQTGLDASARQLMASETGRVLGIMHRAGWQHSCLYDKHIMVRWQDGQPEIALIDLEKLRRPLLPGKAARHDLEQLKRHQQVWSEAEWRQLLAAHGKPGASI
ncbi:MAG: InaA protein [Zoogloeaceae bacterium]|nr:InaA protein [Zoogloeaceae bacterium]